MVIKDGEKVITLEELAEKLCASYEECDADGCPAASCCRHGHNGMLAWLREVLDD